MNDIHSSSPTSQPNRRIGFVSTRFDDTDGVSLETRKWAHVLQRLGHSVYYFAGVSDQPKEISYVVPEAHFTRKDVQEIANISYRSKTRPPKITHRIHELRSHLKDELYKFIKKYNVEQKILNDREYTEEMTRHNYELGRQYYSYTILEQQLQVLLRACFSQVK